MAQQTTVSQRGIDRDFVDDFAQRWLGAWNSHDPDQVLALMTDDIVYDDSAWPTQMRGHADVREFLERTWAAFPDMRFELDDPYIHPREPKAAFYWHGTATHSGQLEPPGLEPTGKRIEFEGVDTHEYRDGKVARLRIVFDMADVTRQLGVLPPAGSRAERMMAKMTNMRGKVSGKLSRRS
jgi:steroid delta-isomerase-like uncharacterized protein